VLLAAPVLSAGTLCPGRRRQTASTATVCIYSMYSVTEGEDVNEVLRSMGRQFGTVCHQLCETAVSLRAFMKRLKTYISSVIANSKHHPVLLGRFVIMAPSIKCSDVLTYLKMLLNLNCFKITRRRYATLTSSF